MLVENKNSVNTDMEVYCWGGVDVRGIVITCFKINAISRSLRFWINSEMRIYSYFPIYWSKISTGFPQLFIILLWGVLGSMSGFIGARVCGVVSNSPPYRVEVGRWMSSFLRYVDVLIEVYGRARPVAAVALYFLHRGCLPKWGGQWRPDERGSDAFVRFLGKGADRRTYRIARSVHSAWGLLVRLVCLTPFFFCGLYVCRWGNW